FGDGQALIGQQLGGAAGGDQPDAQRVQRLRQFNDASLVRDGNEGVHGLRSLCSTSFLRSVLRFSPSHSAALDWFWSALAITTSSSGFSTTLTSRSHTAL